MIGKTVSHYRVLERIGESATGVVYKAEDLSLGRGVALKFLAPELAADGSAMLRFRHEARMASSLNHPNICTVYEIAEHEELQFIVMELMEGQALSHLISGKPLDLEDLLSIGVQICDGLDAAHTEGVIHRDLKPANIFVSNRGQAKILDFGLAQLTPTHDSTEQHVIKVWGQSAAGTVPYMSPEQINRGKMDGRSDLFSLGIVLYEMATGRRAFAGRTIAEIQTSLLRDAAPSPGLVNESVPAELSRIVLKALEKNRDLRYQTASDLRADLQRLKRDLESVGGSPVHLVSNQSADRHALFTWDRARYAAGMAIAAGLIAAGAATFNRAEESTPEPQGNLPPAPVKRTAAAATPTAGPSVARDVAAAAKSSVFPTPRSDRSAGQDLRIARKMTDAGLHEQAAAKLEELVSNHPGTQEALEGYFLIGALQENRRRPNDAMATYLEIADRFKGNPRAPEALLRLAQLTRKSDRNDRELEARRILADLVGQYPNGAWAPRALFTKAEIEEGLRLSEPDAVLRDTVPSSLVSYRQIGRSYPRSSVHAVSMTRLARLYEKQKRYQLAADTYGQLARSHPKDADEAWFRSGEIYRRRLKNPNKARAAYANVSAGSSHFGDAQKYMKVDSPVGLPDRPASKAVQHRRPVLRR